MEATITKEEWLEELCGTCAVRNPNTAYCWERELNMPADCTACEKWVSEWVSEDE